MKCWLELYDRSGPATTRRNCHNAPVDSVRLALRLAYLGGGFAGWQRQPDARTVQGTVEEALARLYGRSVRITGAGRTDAGVHADGQVAHFDGPGSIPPPGVMRALNAFLPEDVRVIRAWAVPVSFHARRSARGKRYRYRIAWCPVLPPWEAQRRWLFPGALGITRMRAALRLVIGKHDFSAFALAGHSGHGARGTVRVVSKASLRVKGRRLDLVIEGDGFLRGMARRIAGALVEVGRGARDPAWMASLLRDPTTKPPAPTAPPHGLTLERVFY